MNLCAAVISPRWWAAICSCGIAGARIQGFARFTTKNRLPCGVSRNAVVLLFLLRRGGDVINFTRKINNLDYVEAVKQLARARATPLPEEDDKQGRRRTRIVSINKDAARFYYETLNGENGVTARRY